MKGRAVLLTAIAIIVVSLSCLSAGCGVSQYELTGKTPTETAQNIVNHYHETHIYSEYDFFVCSDMALDVWDMLKAQGINAIIQIGNVKTEAKDITDADHAWILAEVSSDEYLALETTSGYAVWAEDNPLYYKGWSFDNPKEYKRFVELKQEFNIRVDLIKQYEAAWELSNNAVLEATSEYEQLAYELVGVSFSDPSFVSKLGELTAKGIELGTYKGKCEQLNELVNEESQKLINIVSEMKGLLQ